MNHIIRKIAGSVILVVLLIVFFAVISEPPADPTASQPAQTTEQKPKELEQFDAQGAVLENDRFKLTLDGKYGSVTIVDKRTGTQWGSLPPEAETKTLPGNNKRFVRSPVFIRYSEGKQSVQTYPFKEQGMLSVKQEGGALRLDYAFKNIGISFSMVLRLRDDGLELTVPFDSIKEGDEFKLVSVEPYPFFEAGSEKENGAVVLPDGSGSLIKFTPNHPQYFETYSQFIYGGDHAFQSKVLEKVATLPHENISTWRQHYAALPIFGLYRDSRSFLGIVTEGDHDAKINATPSGVRNIKLYRTSAEFLYRNDDVLFLNGTGEVPLMQSRMIEGNRQIRYVLLDKQKAGYVGMAEAYRNYLLQDKGVKPVTSGSVPYQLRLLGGAEQPEVIGTSFVSVTTFEEARTIIDELLKRGIHSLEVTYDGWSSDGLYGDQPKHYPADSKLGGNGGLKKLAAYAKEKGVRLYLKTNYVRVSASGDALKRSSEAIRGLNKEVLKSFNPRRSTRQPRGGVFYFVRPDKAYDRYVANEAEAFAQDGVQGIQLGSMGRTLYSDPGSKTQLDRQYTIDTWIKSMDLMRSSVGASAVDYGFGYVLGHVDRIDDVPLDSSHFMYSDRAIPFYQIAVHGLVPYTSAPLNFSDNPQADFLRAIEYGAMPSYYMTYDQPTELRRTPVDDVVSSLYLDWLPLSVEQYVRAQEALERVKDDTITGHEELRPDLYRTTYSNGTQIIVNYAGEEALVEGVSVAAADFAIVSRKEGTQ